MFLENVNSIIELRDLSIRFRFNINVCKVDMGFPRIAFQIKIPELSISLTGPTSENENIANQLAHSLALQKVVS